MMRIALVGNTQAQQQRLERLLTVPAEIILDDATRATRKEPLVVDAALAIRFTTADIAAVQCRLLQCSGVGIDGIALADLPKSTIVCNVHEHETPIAEFVLLGMLEHAIGMAGAAAAFEGAAWGRQFRGRVPHGELFGKTVGIVGFGRIGKAVASRARAFGMRVLAVTRSGRPAPEADRVETLDRLAMLLAASDYVVLACPLTAETRGLIGAPELAAMRPTALLINVARGEVVDEAALYEALQQQRIGGALLDTWYHYPTPAEPDPLPSTLALERLGNVRATPHIAGWTEGLMERRYRAMADNLARLARGEPLHDIVWRDGAPVEGAR
jgi:phosphoglycerate dehydrogenase-like enzyme